MRELNANLLSLAMDVIRDALERGDLAIRPQASVLRGDTAAGLHSSGLHNDKAGAVESELANVDKMPVTYMSVDGTYKDRLAAVDGDSRGLERDSRQPTVSTHGAHREPVMQSHASDLEWREEGREVLICERGTDWWALSRGVVRGAYCWRVCGWSHG